MKYQFFADGGHGWIKVSISELEKLKIADKISSCSYMRDKFAYLEEDGDLSLFFKAKNFEGKDFDKLCKTNHSQFSKIRSYHSYDYTQYLALQKAITRYNTEETLRKWVNQALNDKSKTSYFKNKTSYEELSYNAKTWFYNIAKTIQTEALKAAQVWLKIYEPYEKITEGNLNEKLTEVKKEIEVLQ